MQSTDLTVLAPHVCPACASPLVQPDSVEPRGSDWLVRLHCPNCGLTRDDVLDQETADRFDEVLDRGMAEMFELLALVTAGNMREYATRFAGALRAGAILPEDF